ncbi:MAG: FeoA family protein [Dehalobacterium sp.]|jgi:ferrous iron transport protein A
MSKITLRDLAPGKKGRVSRVKGSGAIRRRLVEMGVAPGCEVIVERYAPLGDPVEIKLRGVHISLRKSEAEMVELEEE